MQENPTTEFRVTGFLQEGGTSNPSLQRTLDELEELRRRTRNENGAQRVAFSLTWAGAALEEKVQSLGAESVRDEAGNFCMTLRGVSEQALLIGGHIDSMPNGAGLMAA